MSLFRFLLTLAGFLVLPSAHAVPVTVLFDGTFGVRLDGTTSTCNGGWIGGPTVCGRSFSGYYTFDSDGPSDPSLTDRGFPYGLVLNVEGKRTYVATGVRISISDNVSGCHLMGYQWTPTTCDPVDIYSVAATSKEPGFRAFEWSIVSLDPSRFNGTSRMQLPDVTRDWLALGEGNMFFLLDGSPEGETYFDGRSFHSLRFAD